MVVRTIIKRNILGICREHFLCSSQTRNFKFTTPGVQVIVSFFTREFLLACNHYWGHCVCSYVFQRYTHYTTYNSYTRRYMIRKIKWNRWTSTTCWYINVPSVKIRPSLFYYHNAASPGPSITATHRLLLINGSAATSIFGPFLKGYLFVLNKQHKTPWRINFAQKSVGLVYTYGFCCCFCRCAKRVYD